MTRVVSLLVLVLVSLGAQSGEDLFVTGVSVGLDSKVHIKYSDGSDVEGPSEEGQIACSDTAFASDKQTVGWLVEMKHPSGAGTGPLRLVVYRSGVVVRRIGDGTSAVGPWYFASGGKLVAYQMMPLDGGPARFEIRDVESGEVAGAWEGPLDKAPTWAKRLAR